MKSDHSRLTEEAELSKLKRNLAMSDSERFFQLTRLIRIHHMLKNASIIHKPEPNT